MAQVSALQVSLADVARLAGVARPVVSMWRNRPLETHPFPTPVAIVGGRERFDALEIADYLAATGRGNNALPRADLAAHASLAHRSSLDGAVLFAGLTALLTLVAVTGDSLADLTASDLLALAGETDPDDTFLRREVEAIAAELPTLAAHADALADASWSPERAFELLLRHQLHRGLPGHAAVALHPDAHTIVARLASALAADAGWDRPLLVDVTDGSADLLLAAAQTAMGERDADGSLPSTPFPYAAELAPSVATLTLDSPSARLARRRLRVHDLHRVEVQVDETGDYSITADATGSVHVLQLPTVATPTMTDVEVLDAVGDLVVQLTDDSRVVVIGPASALTDAPRSAEADHARDAVLRGGRLRAIVRLPKGLLVRSPHQAVALWVLGPAHREVPIAERRTVVGDLSATALTEAAVDDLVTDVVASIADPRTSGTHAYRFARRVLTASLITGRKALVDRPIGKRASEARSMSFGGAITAGMCRVLPGHRVQAAHLVPGGRRVIGPPELLGEVPIGTRGVDPVRFPSLYPASRYTEPGDIVFCTSPRVAAWVDRDGGSVVLAPARSIRVLTDPEEGPAPLLPAVVAADIEAAAHHGDGDTKDWRRWPIRLVPPDRLRQLDVELDALAAERTDLRARLEALEARSAAVIAAALSGGVGLDHPTERPHNHRP